MTRSDHREPIKFVGMYFIDEHGEDYRTGQIIAQISDGCYLAQFDSPDNNVPPAPLEVLSAADFSEVCDNCGSRHWQFFPDVQTKAEVDHLVEYARSGKGQDGQGRAS